MRLQKRDILSGLLVLALSISLGCSKRSEQGAAPQSQGASTQEKGTAPAPQAAGPEAAAVDTAKPVSEVQAQAQTMSVESLKATALKYKDVILAKQAELEKLTAKIKEIPVTEALGQEAKTLKTELQNIETALKALKERFQVYYDTLKNKGGDLSNLTL